MSNNKPKLPPNKKQQTKSIVKRREERKKRVQKIIKYLGFSGFGLGTTGTIGLLIAQKPSEALLAGILTIIVTILAIFYKFLSELFEQVSDNIEILLEEHTKPLADWIVNQLENFVVKLWWTLTAQFQGKYYQQLIYTCRDYLTQGLDKDYILKLQKVFVPLKISTQDAANANSDIANANSDIANANSDLIQKMNCDASDPKEKQIWDFLAAMRDESSFRRLVILGAPGSGKTTLLRYIALIYANNAQKRFHRKAPKLIPVLIYLRNVRQEIIDKNPSLAELITEQIKKQRQIKPLQAPPNWFSDKLGKNKCLVMLDGLDEVADENERKLVRDWVDKQIETYPDNPFILSSRPFGYRSTSLQQTAITLEVKPFNLQQIEQFIHNWYLQTEIISRAGENDLGVQEEANEQAENLIERILKRRALADLAVNPLLLTMIATVHRRGNVLPGKRVELYKEICQVLLEKRQRAKKIIQDLSATQIQSVLQVLALSLMKSNTREFQLFEGVSFIKEKLIEVASNKVKPEEFLLYIKDVCGLLVEKELNIYEFAHLSFQEYLAAVQIKETSKENLLIANLNNSWWHETIRLYAAQSNSTNLIRAALALESSTSEAMSLAYECLEEGLSVDFEIRQQLEARLEKDLKNP